MGTWLSKPAKSDMLKVTQTSPSHWKYVSEGGATIVFSYVGPPDTGFDGTVLRLRKALVPVPLASAGVKGDESKEPRTPTTASTDDEPDDPTIEYQAKCMSRLIPLEHLPRLENVALDEPWLEQLVEIQNLNRPEIRREKDGIDLDRKKGVLATDLVGGDWLAVEIKPKWAFLPSPDHLSNATKPIKLHTCRFCMHNHLRESKGEIIPMKYCPLDLFSNDEDRMKKAVDGLWDAWAESGGTVNNLKVFARGHLLRPSEADRMLASDLQGQGVEVEKIRDAFKANLVKTLRSTPVLDILSKLQRTLDALDIEGLSELWRHTERAAPLYRTTFASFFNDEHQDPNTKPPPSTPLGVSSLFLSEPEPNISDWEEFLDTYLSEFSAQLDHSKPDPKHLRYYLLAYLLSATFKDCSIIPRLDFLRPGREPEVEIRRNTVTVIDLDPKSMVKLRGWEKLDKEIATTYAQKKEKKLCVDAGKL